MAKSKATTRETEALYEAAEVFSVAFINRARVRLLRALAESDERMSPSALVKVTGLPQTSVSQHMMALAKTGLVNRERVGVWVYYSINGDAFRHHSTAIGVALGYVDAYAA